MQRTVQHLVVVGSTASGKTTIVNGVRTPKFAEQLIVPRRYITRPKRLGDDADENEHVTHEFFWNRKGSGHIWPHWSRDLGGAHDEWYGFEAVRTSEQRRRVYSANNAFVRSSDASVKSLMETALIVVIVATREDRSRRLMMRSPDMEERERSKRLTDDAADILSLPGIVVINTSVLTRDESQAAFHTIITNMEKL